MVKCSHCKQMFDLADTICYKRGPTNSYYYCRICAAKLSNNRARYAHRHRPEILRRSTARAKAKFPEKNKARDILNKAIRHNKLSRPAVCEIGCTTRRIHAHHDDYTKPLEVRWLCTLHHADLHKGRPLRPIV